ncbi:MAG: immunoglobulin [Eubacteriales bacterium]|jgi:hypothetical protein
MKNYHLTPSEQETIINWDNELDTASIYTHDRRIGKRLLELSRKYPDEFVFQEKGCQHFYAFTVRRSISASDSLTARNAERSSAKLQRNG